jgi:hypothetical protein
MIVSRLILFRIKAERTSTMVRMFTQTLSRLPAVLSGLILLVACLCAPRINAATININGTLDVITTDNGNGVYSSLPLGTTFSGSIDDALFNGVLTGGGIQTIFDCCIAAGGLGLSDNIVLDPATASLLNTVAGTNLFTSGDTVDVVDIEGDTTTAASGRIEIGVSYILVPSAFSGTAMSNYPFNPSDLLLGLFFILEEDNRGTDIYDALGKLQPVPVPAAFWLFGSGLLGLLGMARRRKR